MRYFQPTLRRAQAAVLVLSVIGTAGVAGAASAAGAADECRQGGWEQRVTSTGEPFANQGECVSYGAPRAAADRGRRPDLRCADDGHLDLFRQDGSAFATEAACRRYAATGELVHLAVIQTGVFPTVRGNYVLSEERGDGLLPGTDVAKCGVSPEGGADRCWPPRTVASDGTHAATSGMFWDEELGGHHPELGTFFCWEPHIIASGHVIGIYLVATTAAGAPVQSRTIVPAGCG